MNKITVAQIGLVSGLLLVGCGGGSSSSGGSSNEPLTDLSPSTVDSLSKNAANALPGCTYKSSTAAGLSNSRSGVLALYKTTFDRVVRQQDAAILQSRGLSSKADSIDETVEGDCPTNPGSYRMTGTQNNGTRTATLDFNDYCTGDDVENVVTNGKVNMQGEFDTSNDEEPILESMEVSTLGSGLRSVATTDEGVESYVMQMDDYTLVSGNGGEDATASKPNRMTLDSASIVYEGSNQEFAMSDVDLLSYSSGTNSVMKINSLRYTDPDNGTVSLSSTPLVTDDDGDYVSGTFTFTGADGATIVFTPSESVENSFDVIGDDDTVLGVMDCSGI